MAAAKFRGQVLRSDSPSGNLVSLTQPSQRTAAQEMGVKPTIERLASLGLDVSELPNNLSLALGSGGISALQMATHYAIFANGGYQVAPWLIERVENIKGQTILQTRPPAPAQICALKPRWIPPKRPSSKTFQRFA